MAKTNISPGMQQYLDIKKDYPDAFLLLGWVTFMNYFTRTLSKQHNS